MARHPPSGLLGRHEASAIIPVEAESTSDGVFLATHSTIPITQRDQVDNARGGTVVDEQALLRAVQEQPADQPIIPILGKSGTGKSHLVRWLRAHLETKESTRLIFVPKHRMSLRGILELILEHATGDRADELRAKVATAVDAAADEKTAQLKLRNALAVNIETRGIDPTGPPRRSNSAPTSPPPVAFRRCSETTSSGADSSTRTGPIARLVREKLTGKGDEDKEDAFGFTADDLNLSVDDVNRAGQAAREVAGALTSEPTFRELAATMINEQLGPSVSEVFGVGGDDLKQILTDVRVEMDKQGLELLVLIEDFSIFQGIQGGLIDAITLISTETQRLCPMRVVMAVTTGYFVNQMPETVYTRTYRVFDLDLPDGTEASFKPAGFAGSIPQRRSCRSSGPRCSTRTRRRTDQRLRTVPRQRGVPLLLRRRSTATGSSRSTPPPSTAPSRANRADGSFVARNVLTRVLRPVLHRDQAEIDNGRFPSDGFANDFRTGATTAWPTSRTRSNCGRPETRNLPNVASGWCDSGVRARARRTSRRRSMTPSMSRRSTVSTIRSRRSRTCPSVPGTRAFADSHPDSATSRCGSDARQGRRSLARHRQHPAEATSTTFATSSSTRSDSDSRSTTDTAATVCGATTRRSLRGSRRRWSSSTKRNSLTLSCRWTDRTLTTCERFGHSLGPTTRAPGRSAGRRESAAARRDRDRATGQRTVSAALSPAAAPRRRRRTGSARRSRYSALRERSESPTRSSRTPPVGSEPCSPRPLHGQTPIRGPASGPSTASSWTAPAAVTA